MNNDKTTEKKGLFELSAEILDKLEINNKAFIINVRVNI